MRHILVLLAVTFLACSSEPPPVDGGPDAGPVNTADAGTSDAGAPDAGGPDAGVTCGPESCAGCCDSTGQCHAGTENTACGLTGTTCSDCLTAVCVTGRCETPVEPLAGDTCAAPVELRVDSEGFASATVDLRGLADDTAASCGTGGEDAVVAFDVPENGTFVELVVRSDDDGVRPLVALRGDCAQGGSESRCELAPAGSRSARLTTVAPRGRLFAWVEAVGTARSPLHVELRLSPPRVGDTCATPRALTLSGGNATLQDDLRRYAPDGLSCVQGARDAVYTFTLAAPAIVSASVTSRTAGFAPVLTVGFGCTGPTCNASGLGSSHFEGELFTGTYSLIVSSETLAAGEFDLALGTRPLPNGEVCSEAALLTFDSNRQVTTWVPTQGRADDFTLDCLDGTPGPDSVYRFRVDQTSDLSATFDDGLLSSSNVIALRSACDGADMGCGPALSYANLPPGEYLLFTDSSSSETRPLPLSVQLTGARPQGETCGRPIRLVLSNGGAGGTARITGSLSGATDDVPEDCGATGTVPERIYALVIDRTLLVNATATRTGTSGSLALRLMERRHCGTPYSTSCQEGTTATVQKLLPAGTYFFVVESDTGVDYTLDVRAAGPAEGESCLNPVGFDFPAGGGTRTHEATTSGSSQENHNNACMGYDLPDRVYSLTLTDPVSNVVATATAQGSNNAPALILVPGCTDILGQAQNCDPTVQASRVLHQTAVPAGTYFLWVKGPKVAGTGYRLDVSVTPTPEGDTCSVATPVTLSEGPAGGMASLTGTTVGMADDLTACNVLSELPDHLYSLTFDRELDVKVKMTSAQAAARGMVSLVDATCRVSSSVCSPWAATNVTTLRAGSLGAGTHFFSVDHVSGGPDAYALEVSAAPHQPGETCANPRPLMFSEGAAGGTAVLAFDAHDFFDDPSVDCYGDGADAFFTFTLDRVLDLYVAVPRDASTGTPLLSLLKSCGEALSCEPVFQSSGPFARGSLQPGTYVLAVDFDYAQYEGPLTLQASLTPPTPGDTCEVAIPLGLPPEGGTVVVPGTFAGAFNNHDGRCTFYSPDRVYSFTTTQPMSFIAEATTGSGTKAPALTLRGGTCDGAESTCGAGGKARSSIRATDLAPGTYYVFVDKASYDAPVDYSLKVSLGARPAGDVCASALPLGLPTSGPGQVTVQGDTGGFFHDLTPSCGASSGTRNAPDSVYTFTTTAKMNLRLATKALTSGFRPTVSLRRGCGGSDTDLRCAWTPDYAPDTWTSYRDLPAGTYYVVVDGYDATQVGAFELVARLSPSGQVGESCTSPEPVTLSQDTYGRATLTRSFPDYFEDHQDCWSFDGSDAVFAVTTDRPRRLHARAKGSPATTQPVLSVRGSPCASSSSQLACERASLDGLSRASADLPAGTSYLIVKSPLANPTGTFQLDVEVDDFAPGDVCAGAIPVAFSNGAAGGTATVSLFDPAAHGSDVKLSCDSSNRPDTFFTFTTDRMLNLSATLRRQNTSDTFSMGLVAGCGGTEAVCRATGFSTSPLVLTKSALPAGTHVLVVRGGTNFSVDLSLTP
ncbi:hypothetical protein [Corallococcus exercitus]|uniref:Peptidase C-terminal archaeal/bacterial domain-containing protein n=1 Tax=Corallococcus exercitus TaxID=2316736 RepID=A0A7Y4JPG7_9BACT|nr:hypothetical protein [Corallococcus exercitus]NOK08761.1 hypothetical protein [Corallococcus exercitus]